MPESYKGSTEVCGTSSDGSSPSSGTIIYIIIYINIYGSIRYIIMMNAGVA